MNTAKTAIMTIAITLAVIVGMTGFAAATNEDVIVSIGDGTGNVTIPIVVENVTNLGVCHMLLNYDKNVVSVTNVTDGDMDATFPNYPANSGTVTIIAYDIDGIGTGNNVTVAHVTFTSVQQCSIETSVLTLAVQVLNEATVEQDGGVISYITDDGLYISGYTGGLNGDANADEVVDAYDVLYLAGYVTASGSWPIECPAMVDVDGNGIVTLHDAAYLANYLMFVTGYEELL